MTTIDRAINRAAMPKHGDYREIGDLLCRLGQLLIDHGAHAESMVALLAARGWGTGTLGDGGPRSSDPTSTTERAGTADGGPLLRWKGKDFRYHELAQALERHGRALEALHIDVMAHGSDDDPIPGGTGECACCGRFCRPDGSKEGRDEFRLKAGLCPSCYKAYDRAHRPWPRSDWIRDRKQALTDDQGVVHPEDDSGSPGVATVAS